MELSGLQVFKYLPGAKKAEHTNCKECGFPTCMAFSLKLAKNQAQIEACPYAPQDLINIFEHHHKQPQKIIEINNLKIGGENVLFRHEKTFINKTAIAIVIDLKNENWQNKFNRIKDFQITRVNETFKIDLIVLKNIGNINVETLLSIKNNSLTDIPVITFEEFQSLTLKEIKKESFCDTAKDLTITREKAVLERDEAYSAPTYVYFENSVDLSDICARASYYICKYANMIVMENFDEALISTLMTLRQNIFTDPQKPLQVESKIYEFNNPDENSIIFMTTNFALTFFAVANELESLSVPSYLIVTPADGMSVLTAWSAEKFTAQMVAKTLKKLDFASRVKNKKIIIPGLLAHMKKELEEEIEDFEIVVGTVEAYSIGDFVKTLAHSTNS